MHRKWTHNERSAREAIGFTTIEILIALVIIGLIASFAMPAFARTVAADRVRRAQFVIAGDVERAFQFAARVRKPVTINLTSSTGAFSVADRASGTAYYQRDLSSSGAYALTSASITPSGGITIFPTGLASGALTITLTNNAFSKTVTATIAGQVNKP
jgi:type II secretory pathway pseudopilin PulG